MKKKTMRNIDVRIHVKLEVKVPIEIFLDPPAKFFDSGRKF